MTEAFLVVVRFLFFLSLLFGVEGIRFKGIHLQTFRCCLFAGGGVVLALHLQEKFWASLVALGSMFEDIEGLGSMRASCLFVFFCGGGDLTAWRIGM